MQNPSSHPSLLCCPRNVLQNKKDFVLIDDYAHHPTEIEEVLNGVREAYNKEEIICIFQPHRISRLKDLKKEFSLSFKKANSVVLCPVYSCLLYTSPSPRD